MLKVLNLYCGIGGNRKLWQDVDVIAVEHNEEIAAIYKDYFPDDKMIIADAHEYLLQHYKEFDFIWSSPPCQSHSRMMKATRHKTRCYPGMNLYQEIIFLQHFCKGKWVVENVKPYYEPLIKPSAAIGRHLFWSNFKIFSRIEIESMNSFIQSEDIPVFEKYLDIDVDWKIQLKGRDRTAQILRNCVHPKTGLHILDCCRGVISREVKQVLLF